MDKRSKQTNLAGTGFKTPEMSLDASDLQDEFPKFKQYCNLVCSGPHSKKTQKKKTSLTQITVDWKVRIEKQRDLGAI